MSQRQQGVQCMQVQSVFVKNSVLSQPNFHSVELVTFDPFWGFSLLLVEVSFNKCLCRVVRLPSEIHELSIHLSNHAHAIGTFNLVN
jgi:hypothetical protein